MANKGKFNYKKGRETKNNSFLVSKQEGIQEEEEEEEEGGSQSKGIKPEKNSIFLKRGKTVILVENRKFSRSRMTKRIAPLNSSSKI